MRKKLKRSLLPLSLLMLSTPSFAPSYSTGGKFDNAMMNLGYRYSF